MQSAEGTEGPAGGAANTDGSARTAVLFLTHFWVPFLHAKFVRLRREIGDRADVFVLIQESEEARQALALWPPPGRASLGFPAEQLQEALGYPFFEGDSIVPGSAHFPVMAFAGLRHAYHRFLVVERDVDYSGNWGELLDEIQQSGADFASSHLRSHAQDPEWFFWPTMQPSADDREWASDPANLKCTFNPLYFITRRGLALVHAAHRRGWKAHFECLIPTILAHHGCRIIDLAHEEHFGVGKQQPWQDEAMAVELSTMRWRPHVTAREFLDRSTGRTLFHPIKGRWFYDGSQIVRFATMPEELASQ